MLIAFIVRLTRYNFVLNCNRLVSFAIKESEVVFIFFDIFMAPVSCLHLYTK